LSWPPGGAPAGPGSDRRPARAGGAFRENLIRAKRGGLAADLETKDPARAGR
jgi:hypothetical protein